MRKPDFCICENIGADQLFSYSTADQHLCFRYTDSTIPPKYNSSYTYIQNFKILALFFGCIGPFLLDLVGNPQDQFSGIVNHDMRKHVLGVFRPSQTQTVLYSL